MRPSVTIPPYATLAGIGDTKSRRELKILHIDPLRDPRWKDLVETHPKASVFHSVEWLRTLHRAYAYQPGAVCILGPNECLTGGIVFCLVKSWLTGNRLVSTPFSDHCEPLTETDEELDALLQHLKELVVEQNRDYVEIRSACQRVEQPGFRTTSTYLSHSLDLSRNCDLIFRSLHKDCVQRKVRRAERESLEYESGNSEELLLKFYRLLVITRRRHRLPPQPQSWFRYLSHFMGERLQFRVASQNGQPVAAILTLKHGKTVTYKYGCSDSRWNKLGGTPLLFWRTIEEAAAEGMARFDLGRSDPGNQGLVDFKDHWGTERSTLTYWRYSQKPSRSESGDRQTSLPRNLIEITPDWALRLAGKLLYPHLG